MIQLKSAGEIDAMRQAGRVVAGVLRAAREHAAVGTRTRELDELARAVVEQAGAKPAWPHHRLRWATTVPPAALACSVNDVVVHGVPGDSPLAAADLVSLDCAASVDGWHAAAAVTFVVGPPSAADERLLTTVHCALDDGVAAAVVGNRVGDVSRAMGVVARSAGCGIPAHLGGHGLGRDTHEEPFVAGDGPPAVGAPLRPGMVVTIEPMLLAGGADDVLTDDDGGQLRTGDGSRAAHVGHTVAVTDRGPRVLTAP